MCWTWVAAFFREALKRLGGGFHEREAKRFEVTHVPASVRTRGRELGRGDPVLPRYERISFEKGLIQVQGKPQAEFVGPGHPLLEATLDVILEKNRDLLKRGTVLVDPSDLGTEARLLFFFEHSIQDARADHGGRRRIVSRQVQFVELSEKGTIRSAGYAPYLDYRTLKEDETLLVAPLVDASWLRGDLEARVVEHVVATLVPDHFREVKAKARGRADDLSGRLLRRTEERSCPSTRVVLSSGPKWPSSS